MCSFETGVAIVRRRTVIAAVVHTVLLVVLTSGLLVTSFTAASRFRQYGAASAGATAAVTGVVGIVLLWHLARVLIANSRNKPRVVPYFREKHSKRQLDRSALTESWQAFNGGYGIAADLPILDALARSKDVTPLSSFGFGDDLFRQAPQWSDLSDGVRTVSTLVELLREGGTPVGVSAATQSDLQSLHLALQRALETQSLFSLIVRYGPDDFISGVEMDKREGTFWC